MSVQEFLNSITDEGHLLKHQASEVIDGMTQEEFEAFIAEIMMPPSMRK